MIQAIVAFFKKLFGIKSKPVSPVKLSIRGDLCSHQLDPQSIAELVEYGSKVVRTTYYWAHSIFYPEYHDQWVKEVKAAQEAGLTILVVFHQEPSHNFELPLYDRFDLAITKLKEVAEAVPGIYLELFNEVDGGGFDRIFMAFGEDSFSVGKLHGEFVVRAYPILNPLVKGLVACGPQVDVEAFYRGMLTNNIPSDVIGSVHCYGYPVKLSFKPHYEQARKAGWKGKIWCTEFGMNDGQIAPGHFPELTQEVCDMVQMRDVTECLLDNPGYEVALIYVLWEGITGNDMGFPILHNDRTPRPLALWLKEHNKK